MATYLVQAQYSAAAFKGMVTTPSDRAAAASALITAMGLKMHSFHFSLARSGVVVIVEGSPEAAATAAMVICASGGMSSYETTELISADSMNLAMKSASEMAGKYQAPN